MTIAHVDRLSQSLPHPNWTERFRRIMEPVIKADARQLWLPVTTVAAVFVVVAGALVGAGMWIARTGDRAATTTQLAGELRTMNTQLATLQGSVNALMGMQSELAKTSANVATMREQMEGFETRLQTMDAWIQTTRDRLKSQGFSDVPDYRPRGQGN